MRDVTNPRPRSPPEPAPGGTLYVPFLGVLHWKCPSSLRSDTRMQSIGKGDSSASGSRPDDFGTGGRMLSESPAECVGIRKRPSALLSSKQVEVRFQGLVDLVYGVGGSLDEHRQCTSTPSLYLLNGHLSTGNRVVLGATRRRSTSRSAPMCSHTYMIRTAELGRAHTGRLSR
jgi:hypothetical protein